MKIGKQKAQKSVSWKENLNFKIVKTVLEATQIEKKITYVEKNKIDVESLKEDQKEIKKSNKLIFRNKRKAWQDLTEKI